MTIENFFEALKAVPSPDRFKPHVATDNVVRIFWENWGMNPITAVAVASHRCGGLTREVVSDPSAAARCLNLSDEIRREIIGASEHPDHLLRPRLLEALGLG